MKKLILVMVIAFSLQACCTELQTTVQKKDTKWILIQWTAKLLAEKTQATLNIIGGNKVAGKSFCNNYGGNVAINGNAPEFSQLFGTKMFCKKTSEVESNYLTALNGVDAGTISGGKLALVNAGKVVLVYRKAD